MEYQWKKFERTKSRLEDRITVTKSRAFGFPTKFYQDNGLANFKYVVLYYVELEKAVGFLFTNSEEEKFKFSLLRSGNNYGGSIIATSFFKSNNLDPKKYYGRYLWEKLNQEGIGELYVIKLQERVK